MLVAGDVPAKSETNALLQMWQNAIVPLLTSSDPTHPNPISQ
jgi:hypothetical protein